MFTPDEHRERAEKLIEGLGFGTIPSETVTMRIALAQVHATLAQIWDEDISATQPTGTDWVWLKNRE